MINFLLLSLLHDLLAFLKKHPDFFQKNETERRALLSEKKLFPEIFHQYLEKVSETQFLEDIQTYARGEKNGIIEAFSRYLATDFATMLDEAKSEKKEPDQLVPKTYDLLGAILRETMEENSYQEITEAVSEFLRKTRKSPATIVQTARNIGTAFRSDIRKKLLEMNPYIFPIFQVNRSLIGGMRIFSNGKTIDQSWFSRINAINNISI